MKHPVPRLRELAPSSVPAGLLTRHVAPWRRLVVRRSGLQARRRCLVVVIAVAVGSTIASAQTDGSDALQATVSPKSVTVGQPLTYTLDVPLAPDERIVGPGTDADFAPWEVRDYEATRLEGKARLSYRLVAFETGDHPIPAVEIRLEDPSGKTRVVRTAEAKGTVVSVLKEGDQQPADIREPMALREQPLAIVLRVLLLALIVALVVAGTWLLWRRTRKKAAQESKAPDPPDVVALRALRRLKEARLPEQGRIKQHYTGVSDALRSYLSARYAIRTLEETTSAIAASLEAHDEAAEQAVRFEDLLREADLVKFAKARPEVPACHSALEAAEDLVRETAAPRVSPVEEAAHDLR